MKELLLVAVLVGVCSANIIPKEAKDEPAIYDKRRVGPSIIDDAIAGDSSIFSEKRGTDFDHALAFYDYITDTNKRAVCSHFFPGLCPKLARSGYCKPGRRRGRKVRFAAKFCRWACGGC